MSKEEAIGFLQEIKFNIDYLRVHYMQNMRAAEESAQQEKLINSLVEQAKAKVRKLIINQENIRLGLIPPGGSDPVTGQMDQSL